MKSMPTPTRIWTIGHSRHEIQEFIQILKRHEISALVDVRTYRSSKMAPQFNESALKNSLSGEGINYLARGDELGGRPSEDNMYDSDGRVLYNKLADSDLFKSGIQRLLNGITEYRIALMCSEGKPDGCHRHLLIGRVLNDVNVDVENIMIDGSTKNYTELSPEPTQMPLLDLGEEEPWKSILPVRQESQQSDSFFD
jgi:uncharacterized protein (DUF488 family)